MIKKPSQQLSPEERARYRRLAQTSPVKIPQTASVRASQQKHGYQQLVFSWQAKGWRYQARWHSRLPNAHLVTKPSWRVDRTKAGHGFGASVKPRLSQSWSRHGWISTSALHQSAWRLGHGRQRRSDVATIKGTHVSPQQKKN